MTDALPARIDTAPPATRVDLIAVARNAEAARDLGRTLIASGLLPDTIKKPEQAMAVMLKGAELDIPPMHALSHINIIKGKPTMSAELMRALVQRVGHKVRIVESTADRAVVEGVRLDDPSHKTRIAFDEEDAKRAGLANQGGHKSYPAALKLARATSALCRAMFADALAGISYTPEELGADVDEEGRVVHGTGDSGLTGREGGQQVDAEVVREEPDSGHGEILSEIVGLFGAFPEDRRPENRNEIYAYAEESREKAVAVKKRLHRKLEELDGADEGAVDGE